MNHKFLWHFCFFRHLRKKKNLEIEYNHNLHSNKSANISHRFFSIKRSQKKYLFAYRLWKYMLWYIKNIFFLSLPTLSHRLKNNNDLE